MKIVGIAACPAGVAHTHIAAEILETQAQKLGYECKIETHGAGKPQNILTKKEIKEADYVILALGKNLSPEQLERFAGKKVCKVIITEVIRQPDTIYDFIKENAEVQESVNKPVEREEDSIDLAKGTQGIIKHLMAGVTAAIPFILLGCLLMAIGVLLEQAGFEMVSPNLDERIPASFSWLVYQIGTLGYTFMIPVMGSAIARSIGGKSAIVPAFVCSYIANDPDWLMLPCGCGFLGAAIIGIVLGYFIKYLSKVQMPKQVQPIMPFIIIPLIGLLVGSFLTLIIVAPTIAFIIQSIDSLITAIPDDFNILTGALMGAMTVVDLGGPINKVAWSYQNYMVNQGVYSWYAVGGITQMIPPMACAIACWLRPKLFSRGEKQASVATFIVGATCATEVAIPYTLAAPIPMLCANIISGAIAGAATIMLGVNRTFATLTILDPIFGAATPWFGWYLALAIGLAINVVLILWFKTIWLKYRAKRAVKKHE